MKYYNAEIFHQEHFPAFEVPFDNRYLERYEHFKIKTTWQPPVLRFISSYMVVFQTVNCFQLTQARSSYFSIPQNSVTAHKEKTFMVDERIR